MPTAVLATTATAAQSANHVYETGTPPPLVPGGDFANLHAPDNDWTTWLLLGSVGVGERTVLDMANLPCGAGTIQAVRVVHRAVGYPGGAGVGGYRPILALLGAESNGPQQIPGDWSAPTAWATFTNAFALAPGGAGWSIPYVNGTQLIIEKTSTDGPPPQGRIAVTTAHLSVDYTAAATGWSLFMGGLGPLLAPLLGALGGLSRNETERLKQWVGQVWVRSHRGCRVRARQDELDLVLERLPRWLVRPRVYDPALARG